MRRLSQLASHRTWPLELSSLELVPVAEPGWKGNCIKLFNDESKAARRRRAVPQPPPPTEQGKPPQRQRSQPGSHGATATSRRCSTHTEPAPANGPPGGGSPRQTNGDTTSEQLAAPGSGHCSCHAFCWPACTERACLPRLLSSCLGGVVWGFFFLSLLAGSLLCISNSNRVTQVIIQLPLGLAPAQLGHVSDTWHHTRRETDKVDRYPLPQRQTNCIG